MKYTEEEIIEFVQENNVKFIRLAFCDIYGTQKNISIMPNQLSRAFESGIPFDGTSIEGFGRDAHDLLLFPDPSTLALLPWRPSQGRVIRFFCDIKKTDGTPFELCSRHILRQAIKRAKSMGVTVNVGAECEFYLFKTDDDNRAIDIPFDQAGYMDIAPNDKGENVRREICLTLEEMGINPESSHHEDGPGQNEIDFHYADALTSADNITTFRMVVKTIAARNGVAACFAPKPVADKCGNGFHINLSPKSDADNKKLLDQFIAGICKYVADITLFLNPTDYSYKRLGTYKAPKYISWANMDRSHLIRIPQSDGVSHRLEVRSPDSTANPYIATALLIHAGLCGVEENLNAPKPLDCDMFRAPSEITSTLQRLPKSLDKAWKKAQESKFVADYVSEPLLTAYEDGAKIISDMPHMTDGE